MSIRKYPKGATHCVDPFAMDERFYRKAASGDHLEMFAMGRGEWFKSNQPLEFLDDLHGIEIQRVNDTHKKVVYTPPKNQKSEVSVYRG